MNWKNEGKRFIFAFITTLIAIAAFIALLGYADIFEWIFNATNVQLWQRISDYVKSVAIGLTLFVAMGILLLLIIKGILRRLFIDYLKADSIRQQFTEHKSSTQEKVKELKIEIDDSKEKNDKFRDNVETQLKRVECDFYCLRVSYDSQISGVKEKTKKARGKIKSIADSIKKERLKN